VYRCVNMDIMSVRVI